MKRGEVRWFEFQPPDKRRPVLVLTRNSIIPYLNEVTVAPITSSVRGIPSEVDLSPGDGMPTEYAINLDYLQTVPKSKIEKLITTLSEAKLSEVAPALCFALGLDEFLKLLPGE